MPIADAPILEVYYAATCAPCRRELPALAEVLPGIELVIYVLGDADKAREQLRKASPALAERARYSPPGGDEREFLRQAGDADGILPYARLVTLSGKLCQSWRGILTETRIQTMIAACER